MSSARAVCRGGRTRSSAPTVDPSLVQRETAPELPRTGQAVRLGALFPLSMAARQDDDMEIDSSHYNRVERSGSGSSLDRSRLTPSH